MKDSILYKVPHGVKYYELKLDYVRSQLEIQRYTSETIYNVTLILEEMLTNIIKYSGSRNGVSVLLDLYEEGMKITIYDSGREFNPLDLDDPDLEIPVEDREIGGLGIYIVKNLAENIRYCRMNKHNILTMNVKAGKNPMFFQPETEEAVCPGALIFGQTALSL